MRGRERRRFEGREGGSGRKFEEEEEEERKKAKAKWESQ